MLQPFLFAACPLRDIVPFDYPYLFARDEKGGRKKKLYFNNCLDNCLDFSKKKRKNLAVSYHVNFSSDL